MTASLFLCPFQKRVTPFDQKNQSIYNNNLLK